MSRRNKFNRERCTKCGGETVWPKDLDVPRAPHVCPKLTEQATAELDRLRTERAELLRQRDESDAKLDEVLRNATPKLLAERERADKAEALIRKFVAARDEYIVAINNCHPDRPHDYWRWQGHAEARRQLGARLAELRTAAEEVRTDG